MKNLANAFPEKNDEELVNISKKFYRHLSDLFVEVLKLQHMRPAEIKKRYKLNNPELLSRLFKQGKSTIAVFGHYGNWEWYGCLPLLIEYKFVTVYKPLKNSFFDRYFQNFRSQYGTILVPMAKTGRVLYQYKSEGTKILLGLIADQTPPKREIHYWTKFMNQDTPIYMGIEKLSHRYNMPVVYFRLDKVKRGYYEVNPEMIAEDPSKLGPNEITEKHVRLLEEHIRNRPELWMWSHRRWKHKKPEDK